ncbi:uncharacterized protein BKCO1_5300071 [Diplodia corticola]|uniref:Uncharacterized protein n=1 Tax=Diplodia corticola TaxID=236234 RepID=A0A1J9QPY9_9PEZI|nr:uncharacterized protein BKCO1_5300071 [Diplodia corticola]OJD30990.1 hypothetical protein BKCO1_5300071 [Diplodia corticola]
MGSQPVWTGRNPATVGIPDGFDLDVNTLLGSCCLEKTIHGLIEIWADTEIFRMKWARWVLEDLDTFERRRDVASDIVAGIKRQGLFELLKHGNPSLTSLRNAGKSTAGRIGCVYLVFYDFHDPDGIHTWRKVYAGTSTAFRDRRKAHRWIRKMTGRNKNTQRVSALKMFPLCRLEGNDTYNFRLRLLMEQCAVAMWNLQVGSKTASFPV